MVACLQILRSGKWFWGEAWDRRSQKYTPAHEWATKVVPNHEWRLLLPGALGLAAWTCSRGSARVQGMWVPPIFRANRMETVGSMAIARDIQSAAQKIKDAGGPITVMLRGEDRNYLLVRYEDDSIEVGERLVGSPGRTHIRYGSNLVGFLKNPHLCLHVNRRL